MSLNRRTLCVSELRHGRIMAGEAAIVSGLWVWS
jgi:hypothetical protein